MRIDRVNKTNAAPAPAKARVAAPSSSQQSFNESADEAARAFQNPDAYVGGDGLPEREKEALTSIDDIAARASLNIVERKPMDHRDSVDRQA